MTAELPAITSVGTLLNGTYLLERVIAEGGMGVVYEAQHLRLPRKFAVKVLGKPKDATLAATALQRFRREAEIAATLQHPHIVETFDFQVSEGGSPYLVMELLEGEDLNDHLKRSGRMPVAAALRIIQEMAEALDVAHLNGVIHRDLKPANIFLAKRSGRDDFVKVLDFGVSKLLDAATLTQEKAMVGTPLYMSPEQAVGTQELTAESDVFSFGTIAFEILTGRRAFAASSIPSILFQIVHGPTPTLSGRAPGLTDEVDVVFAKVLAKKKNDRFGKPTEFAAALTRSLAKPRGAVNVENWSAADLGGAGPYNDDRGSGLHYRGGDSGVAGRTEVDSSTRAGEQMPEPASSGVMDAPPTPLDTPSYDAPPSLRAQLFGARKKRNTFLAMALGGVGTLVVVGLVALSQTAKPPVPVPPPLVEPAPPVVAVPTRTPKPAMDFSPEVVEKHPDVQFIFHVFPRNAQISVDDKHIAGAKVTLPWQQKPRFVKVSAPGYQSLSMTAQSTASQNFQLHMERAPRISDTTRHVPKPQHTHDAAPVQDL